MSYNPYSPPTAAVSDAPTETAPPPKPRTVTFTQVFCWLGLAACSFVLIRYTALTLYYWARLSNRDSIYLELALRAAIVTYFCMVLLFLHKRRPLGRWLGVVLISAFFALPVAGFANMNWSEDGGIAQIVGVAIGALLTTAPIVAWLWFFAFSKKARAYFKTVPATDAGATPPAPT